MNELSNYASAVGNYNSLPTSITSEPVIVSLVTDLSIVKTADKTSWATGPLTFTITINNQATESYENPVVTDALETTLVNFAKGSVKINGIDATSEQFSYTEETGTLTVNVPTITSAGTATITFQVEKKA